ncbi:MAG: hypothetical protein KAI47_25085, partial [Deltaproteobacteria bacterium]|nr:hypothetical protein [Deltaproteobacteria bacterium]
MKDNPSVRHQTSSGHADPLDTTPSPSKTMSVESSDDATPDPATPRSKRRSWYFLVFVVLILGGADQGSKHWASTTLRNHHRGS